MPIDWEKDHRRRATSAARHASTDRLPIRPDRDRPDSVVFRVEWPDGLVLGVIAIDDKRHYARFDRTARRWTRRLQPWQVERIDSAWASHLDDTMFASDQGDSDADRP